MIYIFLIKKERHTFLRYLKACPPVLCGDHPSVPFYLSVFFRELRTVWTPLKETHPSSFQSAGGLFHWEDSLQWDNAPWHLPSFPYYTLPKSSLKSQMPPHPPWQDPYRDNLLAEKISLVFDPQIPHQPLSSEGVALPQPPGNLSPLASGCHHIS